MDKCSKCGSSEETRPYGPGLTPICFDCAMGTKSMMAEVERNMASMFDSAFRHSTTVVIGEASGPRPLNPRGLQ